MLRLTKPIPSSSPGPSPSSSPTLTLGYEDRRRSRWRTRLDDGTEVAIFLPVGVVLRDGDALEDDTGATHVTIRAAPESLSVARTADQHLLARAAYHLGNRHIALQIAPGALSYQHDHVLDRMVRDLGLAVTVEDAPFEPEAGGYKHEGRHAHGHSHAHDHVQLDMDARARPHPDHDER